MRLSWCLPPHRAAARGGAPRHLLVGLMTLALALGAPAVAGAAPPGPTGDDPPPLQWTASLDGHAVHPAATDGTARDPVLLDPEQPTVVSVSVTAGEEPVNVSRVRVEGRVLGLAFFVYTTRVDLRAAPGSTDSRQFTLDLLDLQGQATGLVPGRVVLLDGRDEVDSAGFSTRVEGSLRSVYGTFGLAVGAVTVVLLWAALWSLARGRLSQNRWRRGTAFAVPGVGLGLTLTFTVSALAWVMPSATTWLTLLLLCGGVGFAAGYASPTPATDDDEAGADADAGDGVTGADVTPDEIDLREPAPQESGRHAQVPSQPSPAERPARPDGVADRP